MPGYSIKISKREGREGLDAYLVLTLLQRLLVEILHHLL